MPTKDFINIVKAGSAASRTVRVASAASHAVRKYSDNAAERPSDLADKLSTTQKKNSSIRQETALVKKTVQSQFLVPPIAQVYKDPSSFYNDPSLLQKRNLKISDAAFARKAMTKPQKRILFIGYGNMAKAVLSSFMRAHPYPEYEVVLCSPNILTKKDIPVGEGIMCVNDPSYITGQFDDIVIAIKPQKFDEVLGAYTDKIKEDGRVISIAAGKTIADMGKFFRSPRVRKIRTMPNTPGQVKNKERGNEGVTGICAGPGVSRDDIRFVEEFFGGTTVIVEEENDINAITAVSGSGPAYFFYVAEVISKAAQNIDYDLSESEIFDLMHEACKSVPEDQLLKDFRRNNHTELDDQVEGLMSGKGSLQSFLNEVVKLKDPEAIKSAVLYIAENFIDAATKKEGEEKNVQFNSYDANKLVTRTMEGAAALGVQNGMQNEVDEKYAASLREKVTSPSGTTFYGLKVLMENQVDPAANKPEESKPMTLAEICNGTLRAACSRAYALAASAPAVPSPKPNGASFDPLSVAPQKSH